MKDYFIKPENIVSVLASEGVEVSFDKESSMAMLKGSMAGQLGVLTVKTIDADYNIALLASSKVNAKLSIPKSKLNATYVKVKGTFNAWNPNDGVMELEGDTWVLEMVVKKGAYEYKVLADGVEIDDPVNTKKVSNGMGGFNNILQVGEPPIENLLSSKSFDENNIVFRTDAGVYECLALLNNHKVDSKIEGNEIKVKLPSRKLREFSQLRVYAAFNGQITNDISVPLYNGKVLTDASVIKRDDMHKAVMYFIMIDRFYDGNLNNNFPIKDDRILPQANNLGGDMTGVLKKLNGDYFTELGVNTLWLSPITTNPDSAYGLWNKGVTSKFSGYHGYWPIRSREIDYRLGSDKAFKNLISKAHKNDMNVLLDYVANHVHIEHPVFKEHPEWATSLYLPDGTMNTEKWDEHRLTTWFDTHLATLDLRKPEVIEPMVDTAMYWLRNYELDGFRHDATKHIDELFWRRLTERIKSEIVAKKERAIYQVGETYGSPELVSSYVESGQLDAQFDFNLYDAALDAFAKQETGFQNLERVLLESLKYHGAHHTMVNITGNQDKPRFSSLADGSVLFNEDTKLAGWTRSIEHANDSGFIRLRAMTAFLHAIPGIPCIYYGDEIGMPGGNDPDNRRMMVFDSLNSQQLKTKENLKLLSNLRTSSLPLIYGTTRVIEASDEMLRVSRTYFNNEVQFMFYKGKEILDLYIPQIEPNRLTPIIMENCESREEENKTVIQMKPWSFVILETNK